MAEYTISYIVTTYNKLTFLRYTLGRLITARQPGEEIVVCDGGSKDGTVAYLQELFEAGHIQQFISERDKGESHGFNKGMLLAKGELLKIITDDDAYCYPAIREAASFMLNNPLIDVMLGHNAYAQLNDLSFGRVGEKALALFQEWNRSYSPFWMIALPMLVRRSRLPLVGLFDSGIVMIDAEYIFRISTLRVNIAWYTGVLSMHLNNEQGNFNRMNKKSRVAEARRVFGYYQPEQLSWKHPRQRLAEIVEEMKQPLRPLKRRLFERWGLPQVQDPERYQTYYVPVAGESDLAAAYRVCDEFMTARNQERELRLYFEPVSFVKKICSPLNNGSLAHIKSAFTF